MHYNDRNCNLMNMPNIIIDIVVPTYHRYEILAEALQSVQNQTYERWECWIAEDGASEKTFVAVEPFLRDKRFHYLPGDHSGTPATPRNRALQAGGAPYIAFLDDDDIWLPEKLERQASFLKDHPCCVLLGSNAFIMKENQDYRRDSLPLYFRKAPFGLVPYKKLVEDDYFINSSAVIRRSALKYSGLQNEALYKGPDGEDHDLWLRIGPLGEMWLMPDPLVVYRELSSKHAEKKSDLERRQHSYRMRFNVYQSAMTGVGEMPSPLLFPEYEQEGRLCKGERDFYAAGPQFLGRLRHRIGSNLSAVFGLPPSKKKRQQKAFQAFLECKARWGKLESPFSVECIVFSKDRALQLHGLLKSMQEKVLPAIPIHVLYLASSPAHQQAYEDVIAIFAKQNIRFIQQENAYSFKHDLMEILFSMTCDMLFFLVDDILFTEPVSLHDISAFNPDEYVPSLRMGQNLTRCYVLQTPQPRPQFLPPPGDQADKMIWQWDNGKLDWNYPLSVDGHFFARREMAAMASLISFGAPNSFEDQLQIFKPLFDRRYGVGYKKSRIVNIPCNRVQREINNLSGNIHPDILLAKWQNGYQIDYKKIYGTTNESAHQEIPLPLILRAAAD
ncbi:MAG: cell wall biosis glycosyltransferase-like protein [Deltaproteobacteria bacterium]|nr:cell wall biosis glycosyltransferase-like protein [Deltaproteobacteria bacterium]